MSITHKTINRIAAVAESDVARRPADSLRFDRTFALLSLWLLVGVYTDGAAHHNIPDLIDTFFTPWHAILYSGFFAVAGYLVFHLARNVSQGYLWTRALPRGYNLSLLGVPIFLASGFGDMIWHGIFGFEEGIETLISPTHLLLAIGGALLITGPLRAAWRRRNPAAIEGWTGLLPALLSTLALLSLLTFFTEYANAIASPNFIVERSGKGEVFAFFVLVQGITGVLLPAATLMAILLSVVRRWRLPFGSMILLILGNNLLMAGFHFSEVSQYPQVLVAVLLAGLVGDILYRSLGPSAENKNALRWFAFLVPFILYGLFFLTLVITAGTWWSVHLWPGVIFMAGIVGLLISYVAVPSALQGDSESEA